MNYEYDFEALKVSEEQKQVISMGLGDINQITQMVKELVNARAKEGWEPLFPFSIPYVWFRRELTKGASLVKRKTNKS